MEEHTLLSPEKVYMDLDLVGVGSRFVAFFIDSLFIDLLLICLVVIGLILGFSLVTLSRMLALGGLSSMLILAAGVLLIFLILFGYFIFFETLWSGQTPGKRFVKIRAVQNNGSPVTFATVLIRNLLRIVDTLPTAYMVGIISIIISKKNQRLGDMAAGTLVVREIVAAAPVAIDYEVIEQPWSGTARLHIHEISEPEFAVLKAFLLRRYTLEWNAVHDYEQKLVPFFSRKLWLDPNETGHPTVFLEQVAALYQHR